MKPEMILELLFCEPDCTHIFDMLDEESLLFIENNKLLNVLELDIRKEDKKIEKIYKNRSIDYRKQKAKVDEMLRIIDFLNHESIGYTVVKGPILSNLLYGDSARRPYNDIDIVIDNFETNALKVLNFLKCLGYRQDCGWGIYCEIKENQLYLPERIDHHEVKCTRGINNLYKVEIKNALSAVPRSLMDSFAHHKAQYTINGNGIYSYDIIHTFLILCSNTFINTESRSAVFYKGRYLRHYHDIYTFIKRYNTSIDKSDFVRYAKQYNFVNRIVRVLKNLLSILMFNSNIAMYNGMYIGWIRAVIDLLEQHSSNTLVREKDVFLENIPIQHEIINWQHGIVDRIFRDCRESCIKDYKAQFFKYDYNNIPEGIIYLTVDSKNKEIFCSVPKDHLENNEYKMEFLSDPKQREVMFLGFLITKDEILKSRSRIFTSNAKQAEEYTENYVEISENLDSIILNITSIIEKIIHNRKIILRISNVNKNNDNMYQEIDSMSFQYLLEI